MIVVQRLVEQYPACQCSLEIFVVVLVGLLLLRRLLLPHHFCSLAPGVLCVLGILLYARRRTISRIIGGGTEVETMKKKYEY